MGHRSPITGRHTDETTRLRQRLLEGSDFPVNGVGICSRPLQEHIGAVFGPEPKADAWPVANVYTLVADSRRTQTRSIARRRSGGSSVQVGFRSRIGVGPPPKVSCSSSALTAARLLGCECGPAAVVSGRRLAWVAPVIDANRRPGLARPPQARWSHAREAPG